MGFLRLYARYYCGSRRVLSLSGAYVLLCIVLCSPAAIADPALQNLRFEKTSSREERVLFMLNGFYPPRVFDLTAPNPRVVCDFFGMGTRLTEKNIPTSGTLVKKIRLGYHQGPPVRLRAVLDLSNEYDVEVHQFFFEEDSIYAIRITAPEPTGSAPVLQAIAFKPISADTERILFSLVGHHNPDLFELTDGSHRVVCDFPGAATDPAIEPVLPINSALVESIRVGKHGPPGEKVRVVMDVNPAKAIRVDYRFQHNASLFAVTIRGVP